MNEALRNSKGELIISYQDMIEIRPDTLERFWGHYVDNPKSCVGAVGDQYTFFEPPIKVWVDPRRRLDQGTFYEIFENDLEYTLAAIPRKAIYEVGGFDEIYDNYAAIGEKELNARIYKAGYKFYLDQSIEYKALHHPRLNGKEEWDKHYFAGCLVYEKHLREIKEGKRLKLNFL
jgi:hypothetical protein